jgi:hypothetical protein
MLHRDAKLAFTTGLLCRPGMTEAEARVLLRGWPGVGWARGVDRRPTLEDGARRLGLHRRAAGRRFKIDVIASGLRITAGEPDGGDPAVWVVTG